LACISDTRRRGPTGISRRQRSVAQGVGTWDDLRRVSEERLEQYVAVYGLMQDNAESVTAPDAEKLESTAADLARAAENLRQFIVDTFPARDW
jgi:hypothetical protein